MSNKRVHFVILCEDKQHRVFAYNLLRQLNFNFSYHDLRVVMPKMQKSGSGEQHVRKSYPSEVKAYRSKAAARKGGLLVITDADGGTVQTHYEELAGALAAASLSVRAEAERIALLIPKWNIETWIHFLLFGKEVSEDKNIYPRLRGRESDCQPAVERLVEYLQTGLPNNCPPSLQRGAEELKTRLPH